MPVFWYNESEEKATTKHGEVSRGLSQMIQGSIRTSVRTAFQAQMSGAYSPYTNHCLTLVNVRRFS
jgi:hypothetical protein